MKAAVLEEIGRLVVKDVPIPQCRKNGLLVKIAVCAICGTDVKVYRHGHRLIVPPRITGHEISGTVVEVAEEVEGFSPGDRVAVAPALPCGECRYCRSGIQTMCDNTKSIGYHFDGGFAEYMSVPHRALKSGGVNKIPYGVSFEEAALAEPLSCCINGQTLSDIRLGQSVVVIGAGPVGCLHVQLARMNGAGKVTLIDISAERLEMAQIVKADLYIDSSSEDPTSRVMEETDSFGADVIITACSSGQAQELAIAMAAKRGTICFFGGLPIDNPHVRIDSNLVHYRELRIVGVHGSTPTQNALALNLIASGKIDTQSLVTHRFRIQETLEGIAATEKAKGLKAIVQPE